MLNIFINIITIVISIIIMLWLVDHTGKFYIKYIVPIISGILGYYLIYAGMAEIAKTGAASIYLTLGTNLFLLAISSLVVGIAVDIIKLIKRRRNS